MTAEEFAKEFINDFQEDLKKHRNEEFGYYFNKAILNTDPDLKLIKQELSKIGYTLISIEDELWKPVPKSQAQLP